MFSSVWFGPRASGGLQYVQCTVPKSLKEWIKDNPQQLMQASGLIKAPQTEGEDREEYDKTDLAPLLKGGLYESASHNPCSRFHHRAFYDQTGKVSQSQN